MRMRSVTPRTSRAMLCSRAARCDGLSDFRASASRFAPYGEAGQELGSLIINVITATTFVVQIIGPIGVKLAIRRAGEIGRASEEGDAWASEGALE